MGVDHQIEFVSTDFETPPTRTRSPVYRAYPRAASTANLVQTILRDFHLSTPYRDANLDARLVAERIEGRLMSLGAPPTVDRVEIIRSPFFRGMGAYLVGRLYSGSHRLPLALALIHHLAVGNNVPFALIADWLRQLAPRAVVEFIPKDDPQTQRLLQSRPDIFADYTQQTFESAMSSHFQITASQAVAASGRVLYLLEQSQ